MAVSFEMVFTHFLICELRLLRKQNKALRKKLGALRRENLLLSQEKKKLLSAYEDAMATADRLAPFGQCDYCGSLDCEC
jgi:hypothetical protein